MLFQGFIDLTLMWGTIAGCIYTFYGVNKTAAALMVPYILWVSLAGCINYTLWRNNKEAIEDKKE